MKKQHITLILLLVFFGAMNTIFLNLQNIQSFKNQKHNIKFFHPFIQTLCMFFGEMMCGFIYLVVRRKQKKQQSLTYGNEKPKAPSWILLFPAIMDLIATLLSYIALNMVASSVWQISRGGVIITTAIFSVIFLKKKFDKSAIIGCILAFIGITGVQLVTVLASSKNDENKNAEIAGVFLLLASLIFNGLGLVSQKWIFNKYTLHPLKLVFYEGLYGFVIMLGLCSGGQFIQCPWNDKSKCVYDKSDYYLQSFSVFFSQLSQNMLSWIFILCLILSIAISVPIAVTISKKINPISRSLADVCRTLIIWLFGIMITITIGDSTNKDYQIQDTRIWVNLLKGLCFCILIFGTMLYHQMIPIFSKTMKQSVLLSDSDEGEAGINREKLFRSSNSIQGLM